MSILKPTPMTEQQQKLLQEAKDAVAKEHLMYSESVWDDVLSPDKLKLIESVAIKYNELCEADKWISVDTKLTPPIDELDEWNKEHKISIKVLVKESNEIRFGAYNYKTESWSVEGRLGNIQVTDYFIIPQPPK